MDSIIEVQRQTHEEIERFERALYTLLSRNYSTHETKIQNEHKASQILERLTTRAATLKNLYEDQDARKAEIDSLSSSAQPNELSEFYSRLVKVQEHHAKYPDIVAGAANIEIEALLAEPDQEEYGDYEEDPISLLFTGEEAYGRYLDLYAHHTTYNNIKNIGKRPGYLQYLDILIGALEGPVHGDLPKEVRFAKDFENYIKGLHSYLVSFVRKTQPLQDIDASQEEAKQEFEKAWAAGEVKDWEDGSEKRAQEQGTSGGIWCVACQKHYSKQTVYDAHLTSKKHIKAAERQSQSDAPVPNPNGPKDAPQSNHTSNTKNRLHDSALHCHLTTALLVTLLLTLNDTKSNVERRFSLTAREREQELLEQSKPQPPPAAPKADGEEGEEEEEEERIYNPLKLPLGWDGKPIPYWLYKLHGLGVEYRCEICSDHVYMGRKNFDRHFQESRHAFGMRALGLPNTKHFHEITRIEDALTLAEKLKQEGRHEIFEQETMEELEDDEGNVYNRKTYEDLKKQGLI
ncbi:Pre-mRNA-splicing factor sap61 [Marasmius sp. AFHP31]|nr:Pre-mRNA-splicing factor sap61 [Marasmius sp. AFHP31]